MLRKAYHSIPHYKWVPTKMLDMVSDSLYNCFPKRAIFSPFIVLFLYQDTNFKILLPKIGGEPVIDVDNLLSSQQPPRNIPSQSTIPSQPQPNNISILPSKPVIQPTSVGPGMSFKLQILLSSYRQNSYHIGNSAFLPTLTIRPYPLLRH